MTPKEKMLKAIRIMKEKGIYLKHQIKAGNKGRKKAIEKKRLKLNDNEIIRLYTKENLSTIKIANKFNCSYGVIVKRLKENRIQLDRYRYKNWNKGLTKDVDKRIRNSGEKQSRTKIKLFLERKLVNGMKGKKMTQKQKDKMSKVKKELCKNPDFFIYSKEFKEKANKKKKEKYAKGIFKAWNKDRTGLVKKTKEEKKKLKERMILAWKNKNSKYNSEETKQKIRESTINQLKNNLFLHSNTKIEILMKKELSERKINFNHQFNFNNKFCVDFAIPQEKIIIETDGDFWHSNPDYLKKHKKISKIQIHNMKKDKAENAYIKACGWKLFRFWETDINADVSKCVDQVEDYINKQEIKKMGLAGSLDSSLIKSSHRVQLPTSPQLNLRG